MKRKKLTNLMCFHKFKAIQRRRHSAVEGLGTTDHDRPNEREHDCRDRRASQEKDEFGVLQFGLELRD